MLNMASSASPSVGKALENTNTTTFLDLQ